MPLRIFLAIEQTTVSKFINLRKHSHQRSRASYCILIYCVSFILSSKPLCLLPYYWLWTLLNKILPQLNLFFFSFLKKALINIDNTFNLTNFYVDCSISKMWLFDKVDQNIKISTSNMYIFVNAFFSFIWWFQLFIPFY